MQDVPVSSNIRKHDSVVPLEPLIRICQQIPEDFSRCLKRCDNCGACSPEHQKRMNGYRKIQAEDKLLPLGDLSDMLEKEKKHEEDLFYAVLDFTYDDMHRVVSSDYWECELSRALNYAGIPYNRDTVKIPKTFRERFDWAAGMNSAAVGFEQKQEEDELIRRINEHTVQMKVRAVRWVSGPVIPVSVTYQAACPEGVDETALKEKIQAVMQQETWEIKLYYFRDGILHDRIADIRSEVSDLSLKDHQIFMELGISLSPYHVLQELLGISCKAAAEYKMVRTAVSFAPA